MACDPPCFDSQGVNPKVQEVVRMARSEDNSRFDGALVSFYFNNRLTLTVKDVDYIAYKTKSRLAEDIIRTDWAGTQRLGIPYVAPEGLK